MDKKAIKNYLYNTSYQLLIIILPLITTPYVSRVLGATGIGTYNYTNSITQYFILFGCIGLNLYGSREIAYYQNDNIKRDRVFFELLLLRFITVSISIIVYYFTLIKFSKYSTIFLIQTIDIIASIVDISWFFQGIEDFKKTVIRNFLIRIICVVLIFSFVKSPKDIYIYVLCYSSTLLIGNISLWLYLPKYVKKSNMKNINLKRHIKPALILFFPQIATSLYTLLDKTMIGYISNNTSEVAYYTQSQIIVKTILALLTSLGTVMMPRIANLFHLNEIEKIKEQLNVSFKFVSFLSFPMMFGLMAISSNLVPWFFGSGYDKVIINMIVISPIVVFIGFSNIIGVQYLLPLGKQFEYTVSVVTGMLVNCILNFLLISHLLSIGAGLATVVAEFSVTTVQFFCIRDSFSIRNMLKLNYKYILFSLIMFLPVYLLSIKLTSSFVHTMICVVLGIAIYTGLLLSCKDSVVIDFIKKIPFFNKYF